MIDNETDADRIAELERRCGELQEESDGHWSAADYWSNQHKELSKMMFAAERVVDKAEALLKFIHEKHPDEELRCPYMLALHDAVHAYNPQKEEHKPKPVYESLIEANRRANERLYFSKPEEEPDSGWLKRQAKESHEESKNWPEWVRERVRKVYAKLG